MPRGQLDTVAKLSEFNSSCAPVFVQRGALAALAIADGFVPGLVARLRAGRDALVPALAALPGVQLACPLGGMYAWFRAPGAEDSLAFAKRLVAQQGLGLAPGVAFGPEGEGWLRWCFASRDTARLVDGVAGWRAPCHRPRNADRHWFILRRFCARRVFHRRAQISGTARVGFTRDRK